MPGPVDLPLQRLHMDERMAFANWGPFACTVWRERGTVEAVDEFRELALATLRDQGGAACFLGIVEESFRVPNMETRMAAAKLNDELHQLGARAFGVVLPGPGFAGAAIRGVVTGLGLLSTTRYPLRSFLFAQEACSWFTEFLPASRFDAAVATRAIEQLREQYAQFWVDSMVRAKRRAAGTAEWGHTDTSPEPPPARESLPDR